MLLFGQNEFCPNKSTPSPDPEFEVLVPFCVRILSSPLDKSLKIDKMSTVRTVRTFVWDKLLTCPENRISDDN